MATSWSFSRLGDFEKCRFLFWLKHEQRIPEPERELRPRQTEQANDRGSRIHEEAETFTRGKGALTPGLLKFEDHFQKLKRLFALGRVELEGEWGMSSGWEIVPWKGAWLRLKLDAIVHMNKQRAVVIDYKSGKKFGNEVKHGEQINLYALVAFMRYPELEEVDAELWYLDTDEITHRRFTRDQALRFRKNFDLRATALISCNEWKPSPNTFTCRWCLYGPEHSGHCAVGVRKA